MKNAIAEHPVKILMVDDKKENLLSLQVILADRGYEFVEATSGKDALRILLKNQEKETRSMVELTEKSD